MINLSLDELWLIAQIRNISDYENKFKEDLIKVLNEPQPKTETKPNQTLKLKQTPKPETNPKQMPKPEPEPDTKMKINKKKLEEIEKDYY